ncbi:hypothetical protein LJB42_004441 [Komagataella kurtzmanii]|nr:hypothetical protein LJB42_004441 [Komagataella kurtzmanii]
MRNELPPYRSENKVQIQDKHDDDIYDILPSFEMHNYYLNRTFKDVELETTRDSGIFQPPSYCDHSATVSSTDSSSSTLYSTPSLLEVRRSGILNNVNKLPKLEKSPLVLRIHVTKDFPRLGKTSIPESALKEYTSNDLITGYITVRNTSAKPVNFQMFTLSLEGTSKIIQFDGASNGLRYFSKNFLKMFDLSVSNNNIPNQDLEPGTFDPVDGTYYGLPDGNVLEPNVTYKKFFVFKLPTQCLNDKCQHFGCHQQHLMLPPTMGVDITSFDKKAQNISIDSTLGYGRLVGELGTPIKTKDFTSDYESITYMLKSRFIGENGNELARLSEREYHIRFIPYGFCQPYNTSLREINPEVQLSQLYETSFNQLAALRQESDLRNNFGVEASTTLGQLYLQDDDEEAKLKQQNLIETASSSEKQVLQDKTEKANQLVSFPISNPNKDTNYEVTNLFLLKQNKHTKLQRVLKGSKHKDSARNEFGSITIIANVPTEGLPYIAPKLLKSSSAKQGLLNPMNKANINLLESSLDDLEKSDLSVIDMNLEYEPTSETGLPNIDIANITLQAITTKTSTSAPITFGNSSKLFNGYFKDPETNQETNKFDFYVLKFKKLQRQIQKMSDTDLALFDRQTASDIASIASMQYRKNYIPNVVQIQSMINGKWTKQADSNKYKKNIKILIKLNDTNKNNYTVIPTFEDCLISRLYNLKLDLSFKENTASKDGFEMSRSLYIPIRVRKFDFNE